VWQARRGSVWPVCALQVCVRVRLCASVRTWKRAPYQPTLTQAGIHCFESVPPCAGIHTAMTRALLQRNLNLTDVRHNYRLLLLLLLLDDVWQVQSSALERLCEMHTNGVKLCDHMPGSRRETQVACRQHAHAPRHACERNNACACRCCYKLQDVQRLAVAQRKLQVSGTRAPRNACRSVAQGHSATPADHKHRATTAGSVAQRHSASCRSVAQGHSATPAGHKHRATTAGSVAQRHSAAAAGHLAQWRSAKVAGQHTHTQEQHSE